MPALSFPPDLPKAREFDVIGLGANASDQLLRIPCHPRPGEKVRFSAHHREGGGQTATALVTLARLGHRVAYIGGVGDDAAGESVLAGLGTEGVDIGGVRTRRGGLTQRAVILVDEASGERTIIWGRSEGMVIEPEEIEEDEITRGRLFHTDAQNPYAAARAARWARAAGMPVLGDLEPVRPGLEEFLREIDYLIAAEDFPRQATGAASLAEGLGILRERTRGALVMVTRGARGAVVLEEGELRHYPAYAIDAVDTTGAGDVFHGAFAVACLRGMALADAIDFSHAVAAMKCLQVGGRSGIPQSMRAIEDFRRATDHRIPERA
jgi:sugar/nucleoside kinase (ribokinase family)